jgi:hypothetical protein
VPLRISSPCRSVAEPDRSAILIGSSRSSGTASVRWFESTTESADFSPRNDNEFKSFGALNETLPSELRVKSIVLDGEIVCLDDSGNPSFVICCFDAVSLGSWLSTCSGVKARIKSTRRESDPRFPAFLCGGLSA